MRAASLRTRVVSGAARSTRQRGIRSVLALAALGALLPIARVEAQPSGPFDTTPRQGITVASGEARVLYVDARLVPPGRYYFSITVGVSRDSASPSEPLTFSPQAFRFVSRAGFIYVPTPLPAPSAPPGAAMTPCERAYIQPAGAITCDIVFQVPTDVTTGVLEFALSAFDVWATIVRIRE